MLMRNFRTTLLLGAAMAGGAISVPALAQDTDIIVTARRTEERLQDVPISITVFNADQIEKRNIAVATDLAAYTPSLAVNQRFGPEKATFAIRGFNQDAATAPTVGVYFADVVGVRAQGGTAGGNTVGAGAFTDLQNVQVLKGPQGTLQGRNTTGGAVMLVPAKPTDNFEGYIEGTYGNYDQQRLQAAINIPLAERLKIRFSLDRNKRDGYMKNQSGVGPDDYNDVDYTYGRISVVADLTPELENYTIAHWSNSDTNGYASHYESCDRNPALPGTIDPATGLTANIQRYYVALAGCDQIDRATARGDGVLDVDVRNPDPRIHLRTWQLINTTTWQASDTLTIKNIVSYGEYREKSAFSLYSDNLYIPNTPATQALAMQGGPLPGQPFTYIQLANQPGYDAAAESTTTEELQLQGRSSDGKFNYVVGGYLEFSRPIGWSQQRTGIYGNCSDPGTLGCAGAIQLLPAGGGFLLQGAIISQSRTKFNFDNHGVFAQGTFNFTDQLSITAGGRWTFDKIVGQTESNRWVLANIPGSGTLPIARVCVDSLNHPTVNLLANGGDQSACNTKITNKSDKPTWLIDLDFKPTPDTLLYAKYSRGYRQGGVNFTNPGLETWKPEKVDAYEVGAKATFRGSVPGYFNFAAFYNDFQNQQVFGGLIAKPGSGFAGGNAIINAGKSEIKGIEADAGVTLFEALRLSLGYTYLDTKIKELVVPVPPAEGPWAFIVPRGEVGDPLTYSPKHRLTTSLDYTLDLGDGVGKLEFGGIYTYTAKQFVDGNVSIPSTNLFNVNVAWKDVAGTGFDIVGFAQNVTDEKYKTTAGGGYESAGVYDFMYGPPRMYGVRLRFNFGS